MRDDKGWATLFVFVILWPGLSIERTVLTGRGGNCSLDKQPLLSHVMEGA